MEKSDFDEKIRKIAQSRPRLFALDADGTASAEMIADVERYYGIKLPDSYKEFVQRYGGGYFGYTVVFSCDCKGAFYIRKKVSKEWMIEKNFLPVIDLETGDYLGFSVKEEGSSDTLLLYLHEEDCLQDTGIDFYEALLKYGLKSE